MNNTKQFVPTKSNGDYVDLALSFSMDMLILNFKGIPLVQDEHGFKFTPHSYGTKIFKDVLDIDFNGEKFGMLFVTPRSKVISPDLIQLRIDNHLFYTKSLFDLGQRIKTVANLLQIEFSGVNRLDLCCDYSGHDTHSLLKDLCTNNLLVSGRKKEINFYTETTNGSVTYNGVSVGKRSSSRFLRIYNKTYQMQTKTMKNYISEYWKSIGLVGEVWRFEYQLNNKFLKGIEGVNLDNLFRKDFLLSIFEHAKKNHFDIKENTNKSEINKEEDVEYLDVSMIRDLAKVPFTLVKKLKRTISESLIGQKRIIKGLLRGYVSTGQESSFLAPIKRILSDYDLKSWFFLKMGFYFDEFKKLQISKSFSYRLFTKHFSGL